MASGPHFFLIGWRNRFVVMADWAWAYWTKQRWARVVSGAAVEATKPGGLE